MGMKNDHERNGEPVWHVTEPRLPWFTGRDAVLLGLRERLESVGIAALTQHDSDFARGGMGKTVTAREYVHRNRAKYDHVIWLQAYSEHELRAGLIELGEHCGWSVEETPRDERLFQLCREWLNSHKNWLLVLDEVRHPDVVAQFLPKSLNGHLLITSRRSDLRRLGVPQPVHLQPFSEREALEFLFRRTGRDDSDPAETEAARCLCDELGCFPLALELAGAFIGTNFVRFQDYLAGYRRQLQNYAERHEGPAATPEYSAEVAVAVELLISAVEEASPASAELLRFCAGLRPTGMPIELFTGDSGWLAEAAARRAADASDNLLQRDRVLEPLLRFGLVRRDPSELNLLMHRVVQAIIWDSLSPEQQHAGIRRQAAAVTRLWREDHVPSIDSDNASLRGLHERIFPQAMTAAKLVTAWAQNVPEADDLLQGIAADFLNRGRTEDAVAWYREAVHSLRQIGGDLNPGLVSVFEQIGNLYEQSGDRERALPRFERALQILEHTRPSEDSELVAFRIRLANLYQAMNRMSQAVTQWQQIVEAQEQILPSLSPELLASRERLADLYCTLNKPAYAELLVVRQLALLQQRPENRAADLVRTRLLLARVLQNMGRLPEAERLLLPMRDSATGESPADQLQRADVLNRLALVTSARGQYAAAEELLREVIVIRERLLNAADPLLAVSYNDLAENCFPQGNLEEAHQLFEQALKIQQKKLPRTDPQLVRTRNNLAALLAALGRHADSEDLFLQDLQSKRETLGAEHPHVATTLNNLGVVYGLLRRGADEERMFQEALSIREKAFGLEHPQVAQSLSQLANVRSRQGRFAESAQLLKRALEIRQKLLVPGHPDQAVTMNSLAEVYLEQEIRGLAEPLLEPALELLEREFDANHPQVAVAAANYGNALRLSEQFDRSEMFLQRALGVLDQPDRPSLLMVRALVAWGLWQRDRQRFDAAQSTLQRALQAQERIVGTEHVELAATLRHLAEVALAREQFAQAEPLLQRALQILAPYSHHPERIACGALRTSVRLLLEDRAAAETLLKQTLVDTDAVLAESIEPGVLKWLHPLADACFQLHRYDEAEELWQRQLELTERELGPDHLETAAPLKGLAKLYHSQEQFHDAEPLLVRCLKINEQHREANHPEVARAVENLAGLYFLQNRFEEAEPLIQRAIAYKERAFGRRHAKVADALENYAALLRKMNRNEQAEENESRASSIRLKHEHILGDLF